MGHGHDVGLGASRMGEGGGADDDPQERQRSSSWSSPTSPVTRAGTPDHEAAGRMSRVTTAPAPTNASSPTSTPGVSRTPPPTRHARRSTGPASRSAGREPGHGVVVHRHDAGADEHVVLDGRPAGEPDVRLEPHARRRPWQRARSRSRGRRHCPRRSSRPREYAPGRPRSLAPRSVRPRTRPRRCRSTRPGRPRAARSPRPATPSAARARGARPSTAPSRIRAPASTTVPA